MANIAPAVNARGPLFVHPQGIVKRTTFHVMRMYAQLLHRDIVATVVNSSELTHAGKTVATVDVIVSADETGKTLVIMNRHPSLDATCQLSIEGANLDGVLEAEVLSGSSPDDFNSIEHPHAVTPYKTRIRAENGAISVPPHSISFISLSA